ncbi:MAG: hypothetical protein KGY68_03120 [Candidatus Thermoplasmatota archaeon]|nr:hypothetical protein [Candidatus Thermoplasmatota archaeon]
MFSYTQEQRIFDLKGIKVGGQPGVHPTLMVGTIFYEDQFKDPKEEQKKAVELIREQNKLSQMTSIPTLVDIFIYEKEEIQWKVEFALDHIDGIFSLDMPESEVRMEVLKHLGEIGALDRVIYNSLNLGVKEEEIEKLEKNTPKGAVLLGYNPQKNNTQGRVDIIKDGGALMDEGLLTLARECGIDYTLLDTAATPFGEKAGETVRAVPVFKNEFGLPTGCSLHNTVESWKWLDEYEDRERVFKSLDVSIDNLPVLLGADFIYYGPIENADLALPNMAMVDKIIAEGAEDYFGTKVSDNHPHKSL